VSNGSGSSAGNGGTSATEAASLDPSIVSALVNIIQTGTSPQILDIQQQLLRRLLLEGDVVPSRLPAPLNITEVGGYINLLADLGQRTLQTELIASALGVAPPSGLLATPPGHPLAMVSLPNDRPVGNLQATIPLTWSVRSDFRDAVATALAGLHIQGGALPLLAPPPTLPPQDPTFTPPSDWLPLIGREALVMPSVALNDPTSDPVALASLTSGGPYQLVCAGSGAAAPAAAPWYAPKWSGGSLTEVSLPAAQFIELEPVMAAAGFYPASPLPTPTTPSDTAWARLTDVTGLVVGVTTLKSELLLLYSADDLGASALPTSFHLVWNGTTFA
jgi:hypothetical protein